MIHVKMPKPIAELSKKKITKLKNLIKKKKNPHFVIKGVSKKTDPRAKGHTTYLIMNGFKSLSTYIICSHSKLAHLALLLLLVAILLYPSYPYNFVV